MKIYVAGPLSGLPPSYIHNMRRMIKAGIEVMKKGHIPYIPCLDFLVGLLSDTPLTLDDYMRVSTEWLKMCDGILVLGMSSGVEKELAVAKRLGLRLFTSVDEIPEVK